MSSVLSLHNVSKTFGKKDAVHNVSLSLQAGEIYGFLGPNGAGKTTTIRMVLDFIRPSNGTISIFGMDTSEGIVEALKNVGFLSADNSFYANWNAKRHFEYVERIRGLQTNALDLAKQFELDIHTKYRHLSSGNKQKLSVILALMHKPTLLILDEPTRGLDPLLQENIYDILQQFKSDGGTVFMSSHNLGEVQKVCDRVGIIREGKLVASETMQSLRKMHIHEIRVLFDKKVDFKTFEASNVEIKKAEDLELVVHVRGDFNVFMKQVTKHTVTDLDVTHVSLEDMFMRYYK
jgi:ABC-2 type transport system ATP-binding protein